MRMDDFVYHRPTDVRAACALARELGSTAQFLAGGTDLLPDMKRGREHAAHLIGLDALEELRGIRTQDGELRIGALSSLAEVYESELVRASCPALAEAAGMLGAVQIRNQATIGGNYSRAVPCADSPPIGVVCGVKLALSDGASERVVEAGEFFTGPRQTQRRPDELLVELRVPEQPAGFGASYQRFTLRGGLALAVASVAAGLRLDGGRIVSSCVVLGAVAPVPLRVIDCEEILDGSAPEEAAFADAGEAAAKAAQPITDLRGSEEYRRHLVAVLTRRGLAEARRRAAGEGCYSWEVGR